MTPVNKEASLLGDSSTYTECTPTPSRIVDKVLHDIMSMYDTGRHDTRQPCHNPIAKEGEQNDDQRKKGAVNYSQLRQAPIFQTSLLEQQQERFRRENESKEQALLQTQLKQQQMLQRELRIHGLLDEEHDEMVREELDRQEEMLEQEERRRENPLARTSDVERVIPSTKAVSQLKVNYSNDMVTFGNLSSRTPRVWPNC